MQHNQNPENQEVPRWNGWPRANIVLIAFLAIAGFYLITEHRAHMFGYLTYLPFLLLLACPFLHMFMHGAHGGHGGAKPPADKMGNDSTPPAPPAAGGHQH